MAADGLQALPSWLQGLATITISLAVGVPAVLAYVKPKKDAGGEPGAGALVAQAFASQNDISKTLECMKRIEGFAEQQLEVAEKIEANQRAEIERWHTLDMSLLAIKGMLERIFDSGRR